MWLSEGWNTPRLWVVSTIYLSSTWKERNGRVHACYWRSGKWGGTGKNFTEVEGLTGDLCCSGSPLEKKMLSRMRGWPSLSSAAGSWVRWRQRVGQLSRSNRVENLMKMTSDGEKLEMASADSYCEGFCFKREQRNSTIAGRGHR